jgi:uncharacterized membrane protein
MGAGLVLALIPDILYLKDNFGWRMNTIFKLYYQGWALFSVSGAFAVYALLFGIPRSVNEPRASLSEASTILRLSASGAFGLIFIVFFAAGMLFPYFAIPTRANYELGLTPDRPAAVERCEEADGQNCERPLSLDAEPTMTRAITRAEYEVIQCFADLEPPKTDVTIAEARGDSYRANTSRVSMMTGVPTILGWVGHQGQWRGETITEVVQLGDYERGTLLQLMYSEPVWSVKAQYIASLGVDYVMVGQHERSVYGGEFQRKAEEANVSFSSEAFSELGFAGALEPVCEAGTPGFDNYTAIYRVTPY